MDGDGRSVYVSVCGHVERVEVAEMPLTLDGLCSAVSERFDIGHRLRFVSDEDGEPVVQTDDHLRRLVQQRQTMRVLMTESALSELEQRMWQLRQLQWGYFQDELSRSKNSATSVRNEIRQLRQVIEQNARREVELAGEIVAERQARERSEAAAAEQREILVQELRREQRARENAEAALRKDLEDARQTALRLAAVSEREVQEIKSAVAEETRNRGKNIEALLAEWAGNQSEIRQAIESVRAEVGRVKDDHEKHTQTLFHEASSREAFEKHLGEKVRKLEGSSTDLEGKLSTSVQSIMDNQRSEAMQRAASQQTLHLQLNELRERQDRSDRSPTAACRSVSAVYVASPPVPCSSISGPPMGSPPCHVAIAPRSHSVNVPAASTSGSRTPPPMMSTVHSLSSAQTALSVAGSVDRQGVSPSHQGGISPSNSRPMLGRPGFFHP